MKSIGRLLPCGLALALAGAGCARPDLVQGEVEAAQVDVSAKVPGRVAEVLVEVGQRVEKGAPLARLSSVEIHAKLDQATAVRAAARAQSAKADGGARPEEVRAAWSQWQRAEAAAELAASTRDRLERLHRDGVVPAQRRDEAEANWKAARAAADAARAVHEMAVAGARREDRDAAAAVVRQAQGAVTEVESYLGETLLTAPRAGEVAARNLEPGEMAAAGYPVVTLVDLSDVWVVFNLREDRLAGLAVGDALQARFPALGRNLELRVSAIAPQGDFATWRSTSASGGFDLKTFEVRARPTVPAAGLRPGMSAIVEWAQRAR
ncbi:MAG: efflux RND transporter periplasmic adaptor subunit [Vicinamibacteria bacterium]|nr:efflux RND transporter periplasmic adaptor subunit [Vicinamibacteria bacterium]